MSEPTDETIWNAVTRRLAGVESFVQAPPSWRPEGHPMKTSSIRLTAGPAFGRASADQHRAGRGLALVLVVLGLAVALVGAAILAGSRTRQTSVVLQPTGSMSVHRMNASMTLLADGRVLVIGGAGSPVDVDPTYGAAAELYDPASRTFTRTGSMTETRNQPVATRLADGRVLVVGEGDTSADIYDPRTGVFSATGSLSIRRDAPAAALLPDGRVLVVGGRTAGGPGGTGLASAELYDPATGTFSPTGSMTTPRSKPTATSLHDGRVLVLGTDTSDPSLPWAELYDPATGRFSPTGAPVYRRGDWTVRPVAVLLRDGRVLVTGGSHPATTDAEVFDPSSGAFTVVGSMIVPSLSFSATLLPDGRVLFGGGDGTVPYVSELFDPATDRFSEVAGGVTTPPYGAPILLPDGNVLVAGGWDGVSLDSALLLDGRALVASPVP